MRLPARAFVTVVWQLPRNCSGASQCKVRKTKNFLVTQKAGYKNLFSPFGFVMQTVLDNQRSFCFRMPRIAPYGGEIHGLGQMPRP